MQPAHTSRNGIWLALGAYAWWGLVPIYFRALRPMSALAVVGWRVVLSVPVLLLLVLATRQSGAMLRAARQPRTLAMLALSTLLIATNWLVYIYAISADHVYAASIGYYLNPLVNIALGTLFLGERLRVRQWAAVGLGVVAALILLAGAGDTLVISITLALSFSLYGMVRKLAPVESLPGLTIETILLGLPSLALLQWQAAHGAPPAFGVSLARDVAGGVHHHGVAGGQGQRCQRQHGAAQCGGQGGRGQQGFSIHRDNQRRVNELAFRPRERASDMRFALKLARGERPARRIRGAM